MELRLLSKPPKKHRLYILDVPAGLTSVEGLSDKERTYAEEALKGDGMVTINQYDRTLFLYPIKPKTTLAATDEAIRKAGAGFSATLNSMKTDDIAIFNASAHTKAPLLFAEGIALASYQFLKYRSDAAKLEGSLKRISFDRSAATLKEIERLRVIVESTYAARTLVNEPLNALGATELANAFKNLGKEAGFKVTVLNKARIEAEGMGGILAVNRGSQDPPTFTVMEYKPAKPLNKAPVVLVGKGVVYDTGGLSLKPTPNSMDRMKSDMSGAALVGAAMSAIARLKLPIHVIALVPATDNRPGENAYVPGDVITMYSGATVEVLNTDAEGRLILGDALHWAKRYKPELVFDFATLTGAASVAVGEHGIVCMGTAGEEVKAALRAAGERQYERLVEYPLWDEYGDQIKSDIADMKNVGGPSGGAITAGKFLQRYTDYPWMHFDIAGVSFATAKRNYQTVGGTAYGLRMLLDFLSNYPV
jgi:leucyl aminopeptidase